jgi:hypothetical protein
LSSISYSFNVMAQVFVLVAFEPVEATFDAQQ